ncbi:MAG: TRAP transporter small permease subunit [Alphaproteobacteria bacterium]
MVDLIFNNDITWTVLQVLFWSFFALPLIWAALQAAGSSAAAARLDGLLDWASWVILTKNKMLGTVALWAALALVLVQIAVVILRYVFRIGLIELQELILYLHASLFMLASGFALLREAHVRVDIFYRAAPAVWKAAVNLAGVYLLLMPSMALLFYVAWPYVGASWEIFEGSKETSGLPVYPLKSMILVFAVSVMLQGWVLAVDSLRGHAPEAPHQGERP